MNWIFHASQKNGETAVLIIVLLPALFGTWTVGELIKHVEIGVSGQFFAGFKYP